MGLWLEEALALFRFLFLVCLDREMGDVSNTERCMLTCCFVLECNRVSGGAIDAAAVAAAAVVVPCWLCRIGERSKLS